MKTESLFLKRCFWMLFSILGIMLGVSCSDSDDEMGDDYAKLAGLTAEEDLKEPLKESMKKRNDSFQISAGGS